MGGSFDYVSTFEDFMSNVNKNENESNTFFLKTPLMLNKDKDYRDLLEFIILK